MASGPLSSLQDGRIPWSKDPGAAKREEVDQFTFVNKEAANAQGQFVFVSLVTLMEKKMADQGWFAVWVCFGREGRRTDRKVRALLDLVGLRQAGMGRWIGQIE